MSTKQKRSAWTLKLSMVALAMTLIVLCLLGGTMAKYSQTITGNGGGEGNGNIVANNAFAVEYKGVSYTSDFGITLLENGEVISELSKGTLTFGLDVSKMESKFECKVLITGNGTPIAFTYADGFGENGVVTGEVVDGVITVTITWAWAEGADIDDYAGQYIDFSFTFSCEEIA